MHVPPIAMLLLVGSPPARYVQPLPVWVMSGRGHGSRSPQKPQHACTCVSATARERPQRRRLCATFRPPRANGRPVAPRHSLGCTSAHWGPLAAAWGWCGMRDSAGGGRVVCRVAGAAGAGLPYSLVSVKFKPHQLLAGCRRCGRGVLLSACVCGMRWTTWYPGSYGM